MDNLTTDERNNLNPIKMSEEPESYNLKLINPDQPFDEYKIKFLIQKANEAVSMLDWSVHKHSDPRLSLKRWISDLTHATKALEHEINNL